MIPYLVNTVFITLLIGLSMASWVTNAIWTISQVNVGMFLLGIVGIFVPFIGMIHGLFIWF